MCGQVQNIFGLALGQPGKGDVGLGQFDDTARRRIAPTGLGKTLPHGIGRLDGNLVTHNGPRQGDERWGGGRQPLGLMARDQLLQDPVAPHELRRRLVPKIRLFARSEEHTSELQSLMRISYAVFCLKKKKNKRQQIDTTNTLTSYTVT